MESMPFLKPCPFCGCRNIYIGRGGVDCPIKFNGGTWGYVAGCKSSNCTARVYGPGLPENYPKRPGSIKADRPRAIAATAELWNRRS